MIIDFHSHLLPQMDDGSPNDSVSVQMLEISKQQNVDVCIATPHFYGERQSMRSFIAARERSIEMLQKATDGKAIPQVIFGAEVAYFEGLSNARGLEQLCIGDSNLMLLELPYGPWNKKVIDEVKTMSAEYHMILAHLERFFRFEENLAFIEALQDLPIEIQINAHSISNFFCRRSIKRYIGKAFVLGSDMHNLTSRPQNMEKARAKLDKDTLMRIDELGQRLLEGIPS